VTARRRCNIRFKGSNQSEAQQIYLSYVHEQLRLGQDGSVRNATIPATPESSTNHYLCIRRLFYQNVTVSRDVTRDCSSSQSGLPPQQHFANPNCCACRPSASNKPTANGGYVGIVHLPSAPVGPSLTTSSSLSVISRIREISALYLLPRLNYCAGAALDPRQLRYRYLRVIYAFPFSECERPPATQHALPLDLVRIVASRFQRY
jgi:hypothetical protein